MRLPFIDSDLYIYIEVFFKAGLIVHCKLMVVLKYIKKITMYNQTCLKEHLYIYIQITVYKGQSHFSHYRIVHDLTFRGETNRRVFITLWILRSFHHLMNIEEFSSPYEYWRVFITLWILKSFHHHMNIEEFSSPYDEYWRVFKKWDCPL
jgi:hypothetical protein